MNNKKLQNGINLFNSLAIPMSSAGIPGYISSNIGSALKLLLDIKKDGFQWQDIGNFAINSGFDGLYMYPGQGIHAFQNKDKNPKQAKETGEQIKKTLHLQNVPIIKKGE